MKDFVPLFDIKPLSLGPPSILTVPHKDEVLKVLKRTSEFLEELTGEDRESKVG